MSMNPKPNIAVFNERKFDVLEHEFWIVYNDGWEEDTKKFYKSNSHPNFEVIDIGAWIGPTVIMAYAMNAKKIHAVEADPENFQILRMNMKKNKMLDRVNLYNDCIYSKAGEWLKFGFRDSDLESSCKTVGSIASKGAYVKTTSIVDFLNKFDLSKFNIIKIDIEGAEEYITEGLEIIAEYSNIKVLLSIHTPFWSDKKTVSEKLLPVLSKFKILNSVTLEKISMESLKAYFMAEIPNGYWTGRTGLFFSIILQAKK